MHSDSLEPQLLLQYNQLHDNVGMVNVSDRTRIELTGTDRVSFLNGFCTNDIKRLAPHAGCEAFLTNVKGKVVGHTFVFCHPESLILETVAGQAETLVQHLDRYLIREDVQLVDRTGASRELFAAGMRAESLLRELTDAHIPPENLSHAPCQLAGSTVTIRRVPLALAPSFLLECPAEDAERIVEHLAGADVPLCDRRVLEITRVEAGMPFYGQDITAENLPQEVNRDAQAISFVKGCYLGQETVARIDALGHVNRTLVQVQWEQNRLPQLKTELTADGQAVGRVTSAVWSPRCRSPLSLAYVRSGHGQVGQRLSSANGDAVVVDLASPRGPRSPDSSL